MPLQLDIFFHYDKQISCSNLKYDLNMYILKYLTVLTHIQPNWMENCDRLYSVLFFYIVSVFNLLQPVIKALVKCHYM